VQTRLAINYCFWKIHLEDSAVLVGGADGDGGDGDVGGHESVIILVRLLRIVTLAVDDAVEAEFMRHQTQRAVYVGWIVTATDRIFRW
jgi:hypothetical protein